MSTRPSRKGDMVRRPSKLGLSRGNTELSSTQQTRGARRSKGSVTIKTLESELKKTMPPGWNIREGFKVRRSDNNVLVIAALLLLTQAGSTVLA